MKLLTQEIRNKLPPLYSTEQTPVEDKIAVVKFFAPTSQWTWYACEFDGEDEFFGWVVGHEKEWGYFSLSEIESITLPMGLKIERDQWFKSCKMSKLDEWE